MKLVSFNKAVLSLLAASVVIFSTNSSHAAEQMQMPKPGPEHAWLQQLVGNWTAETDVSTEPGKAPTHIKGSETVRPIGGFWTVTEVKSTMMNQPFNGVMTLGYDPEAKQYIGTWVDSMTSHIWNYTGQVDATGKKLTLESEGACPISPGKLVKFKEVTEIQDKDHKVFSSYMQGDDGQWLLMMTSHAKRVK